MNVRWGIALRAAFVPMVVVVKGFTPAESARIVLVGHGSANHVTGATCADNEGFDVGRKDEQAQEGAHFL